jgi:hypothetical protein
VDVRASCSRSCSTKRDSRGGHGSDNTFKTSTNNSTGTFQLKGSVLHASDGAIEEEGHYVTLLCEDDSSWILIDNKVCKPIDEDRARNLLSGAHNDFLVVYGNDEEDPEMVQLLDDLKRRAAAEGTNEVMSLDSYNPEAIVA